MNQSDLSLPATDGLLEVPMTIRSSGLYAWAPWAYRIPLLRRAANRLAPALSWLCPIQPTLRASLARNFNAMLELVRRKRAEGASHLEFMLHSSELMPGGSPSFRSESDIDCLYEHLEILFEDLSAWCRSVTLREFRTRFGKSRDGSDPCFQPCAPARSVS